MRLVKLASLKDCTGCMVCFDTCSHGALQMKLQNDGHYYPEVDENKCIHCFACERKCPVINGFDYTSLKEDSLPFVAWATDNDLRLKSTSGGVFAALAQKVLQQGGVVVGAISAGVDVKHIAIEKEEELFALQGSKYLQSDMRGIYRKTKSYLETGRFVLFSGTGCQIAGLFSFLGHDYDTLLTADLVCAGVPSRAVMDLFIKEVGVSPFRIRWRDKEEGWRHSLQISLYTQDGILKYKPGNCFFGGGFLCGYTNRYSCYDCKFCGKNRKSDFTLADFWGIEGFEEQCYAGVSCLVVHNEKAMSFLKSSNIEFHEVSWPMALKENYRMVLGRKRIPFERKLWSFALKRVPYSVLRRIYGGQKGRMEFLYLPYKVFCYVRYKRNVRWIQKNKEKA